MPIRIFYIDEEESAVRTFQRKLGAEYEVLSINFSTLDNYETLESIVDERNYDYLVVDYNLTDKSVCGFNGDRVVIDFLNKFPHFPVMLLTNHGEEAIHTIEGIDNEIIHSKAEYTEPNIQGAFIARLNKQIERYQERIASAESTIEELLSKKSKGEDFDVHEEETLIQLDSFLDEVHGADTNKVPDELKKQSNDSRIESLLTKTDELIKKLDQYEALPQ